MEPSPADQKRISSASIRISGAFFIGLAGWMYLGFYVEYQEVSATERVVTTAIVPTDSMSTAAGIAISSLAIIASVLLAWGAASLIGGAGVYRATRVIDLGPATSSTNRGMLTDTIAVVMRIAAIWHLSSGAYLYWFFSGKTDRSYLTGAAMLWVGGLGLLVISMYVVRRKSWAYWAGAAVAVGLSLPTLAEHWRFLNWFMRHSLVAGVALADWVLHGLIATLCIAEAVRQNRNGLRLSRKQVMIGSISLAALGVLAFVLFFTRPPTWYLGRWKLSDRDAESRLVAGRIYKLPWLVQISEDQIVVSYGPRQDPVVCAYRITDSSVDAADGVFRIAGECERPPRGLPQEKEFFFKKPHRGLDAVERDKRGWRDVAYYSRIEQDD
jgi:hypothetical protein